METKLIASEKDDLDITTEWYSVVPEPGAKPMLSQPINYYIQNTTCPQCMGDNIYNIKYQSYPKRYGMYCIDCNLTFIARLIFKWKEIAKNE